MPGVYRDNPPPNVAIVYADTRVTALTARNILLDGSRSAFAMTLAGENSVRPTEIRIGTGTAIPKATDTALQYDVTGKAAIAIRGLQGTAQFQLLLGPTQVTGLVTELLLRGTGNFGAGVVTGYFAKVLLNGGTGFDHPSGSALLVTWEFVLSTGHQPF